MAKDVFGKLYKSSKLDRRSPKSDRQSQWLKNATRSVGDSAFKIVQEYMPAVTETGVSIRDIRGDLRESFVNTKRSGITKAGSLMSLGKEIWKNSLDDLKSGNFHNQERINASSNFGLSGLDNLDIDLGGLEDFDSGEDDFSVDVSSEDGLSSVNMNKKSGGNNEVTQINIDTNLDENSAIVRATEKQTQISVQATQALADVTETNTKVMMTHLSKLGKAINGQLASINDNLSSITTVVSESLTAHVSVSTKYYEDSIDLFRSMDTRLKDIGELITATSSTNQTDHDASRPNNVLDLFSAGGSIDILEYGKLIKKQLFNNTPLGMVSSLGKMGVETGMLNDFKASPISSILTSTMKAVIPGVMKTAAETFGNQLRETLVTGLFRVNGLKRSTNPILQFIGNVFGIRNSKYTADKKNYNKGPMAWNGIAHRTLVDVIPTYLSQIASAVTGTEQHVFDYEKGKYRSLKSIREEHENTLKRKELGSYDDIRQEFSEFSRNFDLSDQNLAKYRELFDKYLTDIARSDGHMSFTNKDEVVSSVGDENVAKMIQKFMRYAPKDMVTAAYGRNALESVDNLNDYNRRIEADPTKYNYHYIDNGMTTISDRNVNKVLGSTVDTYNNDNLYYLRKILQTINTVVPVRIIKGGKGFNKRMLADISAQTTISSESVGNSDNEKDEPSTSIRSGRLSMEDLDNLSDEELKQKIKERNWEDSSNSKESKVLKRLKSLGVKEDSGFYQLAANLTGKGKRAGEKGANIFNNMTNTLFDFLFGSEDKRGLKGVFNKIIDGVKNQMLKFGSFIDEKMIKPLNESLFGDEGLITRMKESETMEKLKSKISNAKNKAFEFIFGTKGEDGKRTGGLIGDTLNSMSEMGTKAKDFILHDEDGVVGSMKKMYNSITTSVKNAIGIQEDENEKKTPFSQRIHDGASDFLAHIKQRGSEWVDLIFGGKETKTDEDKEKIINSLNIFKSDMKGKGGKLGASAALGLIGSFFLPGGPITGSLLGLSAGIVSESSQLKQLLFGKLNEDGTRSDTGIISQQFQNFFKENKTGMSIGAFAGLAASFGLLPALFVPGGPIGGAIIGGAISLANKSGAFNDLLYGDGGSEDNITGGITKFIKDHYKKDGNIKTTFMDAGMGAGVGLIGSFFLPGGPITGSLLGAAANIAINTDKFKNLLFGEEVLDKDGNPTGKRKGGLVTKFTDYIGDKVLLPLSKATRVAQVKIMGFIEKHMVNPFKVAIKPFQIAGKNFVEGIKSTVADIKESFKARVTKPIGDAVEEHILKPMRNAFSKIFSGLGKIIGSFISAPFKMFQGAAKGLNKTQVKNGESDYDMDAELERLNAGTDAKTKRNLKKTRKENKKRKHFRDFFGNKKGDKQQTATSGNANEGTKISTPEPVVSTTNAKREEADYDTTVSTRPYSDDEYGEIVEELHGQAEEQRASSKTTVSSNNTEDTGSTGSSESQGTTTRVSLPYNLQHFAENGNGSSTKTGDTLNILTDINKTVSSMSEKVTEILNKLTNKDSSSESTISSKDDPDSIPRRISSIDTNVGKIANSVDGQLNGVGYNVNKILRVLLKKNGMNDSDVEGENNKKYSRFGKLKNLLMSPITLLRGAVTGAVDAVKGVISSAIEGVTKIAKGLIALPKTLLRVGLTAIKGIGKSILGIAKGVGSAITTGLNAVGNVITSAASGFGKMIGEASEGFGKLIGGALGGIGNLLHGVGLIGKELAPVIGKGIANIIKAPFKLAGVAGGLVSKLFHRNKKGTKGGGVSHVIVDEYAGEDRIISALKAIEFAIIHGGPIDGEGPKFKGSTALPVNDPSTPEDETGKTTVSSPMNLQFFANKGRNGNGLPNTIKAETKEDEKLELATRVAEGSASEVNERFEQEDEKAEERSFRERLLGLFHSSNKEQKKQGINWSAIFSKKGLITGALIAAVPLLIKFLPKIWDIVKSVGAAIADIAGNFLNNLGSQGGLLGLLNGGKEAITSVTDAAGLTDRQEYAIGDNGEILTDENGAAIKNTITGEGVASRAVQFFTPTTTKIDHETGEAYQVQQYDAVTRGKLHYARAKSGKAVKKARKVKKAITKVSDKVHDGAERIAKSKLGKRVANSKAVEKVTTKVSGATTAAKSFANDKIDKIMKYGKEAFDALASKAGDFVKKHCKGGGKLKKVLELITRSFKKVFKADTIIKYMGKFTKALGKIAGMAATLATSEIFWGITGAIEGATNAAYTFEVDEDAVDWKMRAIATFFRALLATSIGSWVDLADSIIYEISGTSFVNELAVQLYYAISDDEDDAALRQARDDFNKAYDKYVEDEYAAYQKNQEKNGQAAMSLDEFKQSDLSTSRQEYNSEQNKSFTKRVWDTVNGGWNKLKGGVKKIGTTISKSGIGGAVVGAAKKGAGVVKSGVTAIKDAAVGVGGAVVGAAKKGAGLVKNGLTAVADKASNIGATVREKWDNSKLKEVVGGISNFGATLTSGLGGILKNAWTGNSEDLITFPADDDSIGTAMTKYALIGGKVILTPVTAVIKLVRFLKDKIGGFIGDVANIGGTIGAGITGIIQTAWTGDDSNLVTFSADDKSIGTSIAKFALIGADALLTPVKGVIKVVRVIKDKFQELKTAMGVISGQIGASVGGRISAAWSGEEYTPGGFEGAGPLTQICSVIDTVAGVITTPVTGVIKIGRFLYDKFQDLKSAMGVVGGQVIESVGGRVAAAWNGEDYETPEFEGAGPLTQICSVIDTVAGVITTPVTLGIKAINFIGDKLSDLWGGIKKFGSNIASYVDVFGSETTTDNYWKNPNDDTGFLGGISNVFFYLIRGVMAIPFYLVNAVKNLGGFIKDKIGDFANGVADFFGAGSAFNVEEDGESGGNGGGGTAVHKPSSKLNGFTYYSQNDSALKNQSYDQSDGTPGTMGERGCGPTALSMVASELTGQTYDPTTMARIAENTGYSTEVGTTTGYFGNVGSTLGMGVAEGQANPTAIRASLENGNPVILQGTGNGDSPYTSNGHYVVGVGMQGDDVIVNDPRGPQYSGAYPMDSVMNGAAGMWSFSGGMGPSNSGTSVLSKYNPYMGTWSHSGANSAGTVSDTSSLQNRNPYTGTTISNSSQNDNQEAEQALVNAMYSIKDKLAYSMEGPRNPDKGSADCSSTVQWAYQKTLGIDPGSNTRSQIASSAGYNVDAYSGGPPNESNLRPGDLLFYGKKGVHDQSGVGHVEMYVGDNKLMGHGGGSDGSLPGPTEKDMSSYRVDGYIGAKRYIGDGTDVVNNFAGATTSGTTASSTSVSSADSSTSDSGGFSLSNIFSGAINAIQTGINNFFGMSSSNGSSSSSTSGGTSMSTDGSSSSITAANVDAGDEQLSIWKYWMQQGLTKEGTAGLMGNLEQESGNHAVRVQGDMAPPYQKSQEYTKGVDSGSYTDSNFINDKKGYGLAQWTWSGRKQGLLEAARSNNTSVGDLGTQLAYLNHELNTKYPGVLNTLKTATDIKTASNAVLHDFEAPADQSATVENQRASLGQGYYDKFSNVSSGSTANVSDTSTLKNQNPYIQSGGMGDGPKHRPTTTARYSTKHKSKSMSGGMGPATPAVSASQTAQQVPVPNYSSIESKPSTSPIENMTKLFDYLGKIVGYLESTSSGISQLNQKDFGGNSNYVNSPSYTNVNGGAQSTPPDTTNYELGRMIAQGQLT